METEIDRDVGCAKNRKPKWRNQEEDESGKSREKMRNAENH